MSSSFLSSRKHPRESTDGLSGNEVLASMAQSIESPDSEKRPRKRPRQNNPRRDEKMGQRAAQTNVSEGLEGLALEKDVEDDDQPILRGRQRKKDKQRARSPTSTSRSTSTPNIIDLTTNSPTTTPTDPLLPILTKIQHHISTNNHRAAYILLSTTTRGTAWQSTASRTSLLQIYNLTKLLGDGKTQCLEQIRMINDARRREMEMEAEIKGLRRENGMLKGEGKE